MGAKKLRVADVARGTGLNRKTVQGLYNEDSKRIDFETLERLCLFLEIEPGDLLVLEPGQVTK